MIAVILVRGVEGARQLLHLKPDLSASHEACASCVRNVVTSPWREQIEDTAAQSMEHERVRLLPFRTIQYPCRRGGTGGVGCSRQLPLQLASIVQPGTAHETRCYPHEHVLPPAYRIAAARCPRMFRVSIIQLGIPKGIYA